MTINSPCPHDLHTITHSNQIQHQTIISRVAPLRPRGQSPITMFAASPFPYTNYLTYVYLDLQNIRQDELMNKRDHSDHLCSEQPDSQTLHPSCTTYSYKTCQGN